MVDFLLLFVVGWGVALFTYRVVLGGQWRDIYGKFWNPPLKGAVALGLLVGVASVWIIRELFP